MRDLSVDNLAIKGAIGKNIKIFALRTQTT
jgi:hypothetical protein